MKTNCQLVAEFMRQARQTMPFVPTIPSESIRDLRVKLIQEEAKEVTRAAMNENLPAIAKELADLLYVVYGKALAYGIPIDEVFQIVHRSNMTKFGPDGTLMKDATGKVMKGPWYRPAEPAIEELFVELTG